MLFRGILFDSIPHKFNNTIICSIVTGLGNLVNLAGGIMLIKHTNLGLSGSPIATTISRFAMCGALYCFYEFRALQLKRRGDEPRSELGREQCVMCKLFFFFK
jgi:Na+-driven multidrug efflux pump